MLYQRWRDTAKERRHDLALRDLASGQCWTFAQLFAAGIWSASATSSARVAARHKKLRSHFQFMNYLPKIPSYWTTASQLRLHPEFLVFHD